jgi:small subunit ribosomal protein S16
VGEFRGVLELCNLAFEQLIAREFQRLLRSVAHYVKISARPSSQKKDILRATDKRQRTKIMVRIRLRRTGAKNNPAYRVVIADQKSPRDGAFIDTIGHYLPTRQPAVVEIDEEKARKWLSQGAQPSETVRSLLKQKGIV